MYDLVAKRFIAAFYPDCEFSQTTVNAEVGQVAFKATGKQIVKPGWRDVYARDAANDTSDEAATQDDNAQQVMPDFVKGESGPHEPTLLKKATQPPKPYTEGTLLRAMETAGKFVDDEELREAMKEKGIGRPSTRAAIIETLFKRRYIRKERKSLVATPAGVALIATINEELLKSAKLTGLWENKLRRIERGDYSAEAFIDELKQLIHQIVINVLSDNSHNAIEISQANEKKPRQRTKASKPRTPKPKIESLEQIKCPVCGNGHLIKGRTAYGCSEYRAGCAFRLPFADYPDTLTPDQLAKKMKSTKKK